MNCGIHSTGRRAIYFHPNRCCRSRASGESCAANDKHIQKIDILFNNAGIHNHGPGDPHDEDINIYDHVLNVNLKGAFLCTKYVVTPMIENNGDSIINNSSVLDSSAANSSSTSYHVSKGGLAMLTKKSALSYAKFNIRVNSI